MCVAQNSGQKVVPIEIDSFGGQVYSLMSMIAAIKASRIPLATIVQGKAISTLKIDKEKILRPNVSEEKLFVAKDNAIIRLN